MRPSSDLGRYVAQGAQDPVVHCASVSSVPFTWPHRPLGVGKGGWPGITAPGHSLAELGSLESEEREPEISGSSRRAPTLLSPVQAGPWPRGAMAVA